MSTARFPTARLTLRVVESRLRRVDRADEHRSARRRAAVAVVVGVLLVLAAQFGLGWAIDTERLPLRDPIYFDKLAIFREHRMFHAPLPDDRPMTLLFVGSSRTMNAVNAGAVGPQLTALLGRPVAAFNFGQAGAGPITNAVYVRRLIHDGVQPDFVLIEVHPVFLAGQRPDPPETRWLLPLRLRREELPIVRAMGFPAADPPVHGIRGYLAPWQEYRFLIVDRYAPFLLMDNNRLNGGHESDRYGFTRLQDRSVPEDRPALLAIARKQYDQYFTDYTPNGCGVNGLRDSLEQCRAAGWRAALVLMPESTEWLAWYPPEGLRALDGVLQTLASEFRVPLIDTRRWVADHQSVDGHHLTGPGADALTERLCREALAPWMASIP